VICSGPGFCLPRSCIYAGLLEDEMKYFAILLIMLLGVLAVNWINDQPPFFWDYFWIYLIGVVVGEVTFLLGGHK
jgi:hypothetical protein